MTCFEIEDKAKSRNGVLLSLKKKKKKKRKENEMVFCLVVDFYLQTSICCISLVYD